MDEAEEAERWRCSFAKILGLPVACDFTTQVGQGDVATVLRHTQQSDPDIFKRLQLYVAALTSADEDITMQALNEVVSMAVAHGGGSGVTIGHFTDFVLDRRRRHEMEDILGLSGKVGSKATVQGDSRLHHFSLNEFQTKPSCGCICCQIRHCTVSRGEVRAIPGGSAPQRCKGEPGRRRDTAAWVLEPVVAKTPPGSSHSRVKTGLFDGRPVAPPTRTEHVKVELPPPSRQLRNQSRELRSRGAIEGRGEGSSQSWDSQASVALTSRGSHSVTSPPTPLGLNNVSSAKAGLQMSQGIGVSAFSSSSSSSEAHPHDGKRYQGIKSRSGDRNESDAESSVFAFYPHGLPPFGRSLGERSPYKPWEPFPPAGTLPRSPVCVGPLPARYTKTAAAAPRASTVVTSDVGVAASRERTPPSRIVVDARVSMMQVETSSSTSSHAELTSPPRVPFASASNDTPAAANVARPSSSVPAHIPGLLSSVAGTWAMSGNTSANKQKRGSKGGGVGSGGESESINRESYLLHPSLSSFLSSSVLPRPASVLDTRPLATDTLINCPSVALHAKARVVVAASEKRTAMLLAQQAAREAAEAEHRVRVRRLMKPVDYDPPAVAASDDDNQTSAPTFYRSSAAALPVQDDVSPALRAGDIDGSSPHQSRNVSEGIDPPPSEAGTGIRDQRHNNSAHIAVAPSVSDNGASGGDGGDRSKSEACGELNGARGRFAGGGEVTVADFPVEASLVETHLKSPSRESSFARGYDSPLHPSRLHSPLLPPSPSVLAEVTRRGLALPEKELVVSREESGMNRGHSTSETAKRLQATRVQDAEGGETGAPLEADACSLSSVGDMTIWEESDSEASGELVKSEDDLVLALEIASNSQISAEVLISNEETCMEPPSAAAGGLADCSSPVFLDESAGECITDNSNVLPEGQVAMVEVQRHEASSVGTIDGSVVDS